MAGIVRAGKLRMDDYHAMLAELYPDTKISTIALAAILHTYEQDRPETPPVLAGEEQVRVMRLYVFEGPRPVVEQQLMRSIPDGTRDDYQRGSVKIHVATIRSGRRHQSSRIHRPSAQG